MKKKIFASLATVTLICSASAFGTLTQADSNTAPQNPSVTSSTSNPEKAVTISPKPVYDGDTKVTGTWTGDTSKVYSITISGLDSQIIFGVGHTNTDGTFSADLDKPARLGEVRRVNIIDGTTILASSIITVAEKIPAPKVNIPVYEGDTAISGTGYKENNTIVVTNNAGQEIGSGKVGADLKFSAQIPSQPANSTLHVVETDGTVKSDSTDVTVISNEKLLTPTLNPITASDKTITGTGTPGSKVFVILGTSSDTYEETIKSDGTFTITLDHTYPAGTSVTAYAEDDQGNRSDKVYAVVQPGEITLGVNQILSSDTFVSGYTSPYANIEISVNNTRAHIFKGMADGTGKYNVSMNGLSYPAGTTVVVTAELDGQTASKTVTIYPKLVHIDTLKVGDTYLTGTADPNAIVYISIGNEEYQFMANAAGSFFGNLDKPLVSGDKVTAYQVSNNMQSGNTTIDIT